VTIIEAIAPSRHVHRRWQPVFSTPVTSQECDVLARNSICCRRGEYFTADAANGTKQTRIRRAARQPVAFIVEPPTSSEAIKAVAMSVDADHEVFGLETSGRTAM
jgi:hypothetical protein